MLSLYLAAWQVPESAVDLPSRVPLERYVSCDYDGEYMEKAFSRAGKHLHSRSAQ